ncbi:hypothetical protein BDF21DRAFT_380956 [Thamnidium elegans]|uniref:Uncharacterized protein n=1 Tax=Thamnidium elegans TaxID=101142 RepID=A0A8H7SMZ9_9FUNG|nr:hypothetical protein INT48_000647 [Thamnidium elegans]KAI8083712.1 hypothetical protein BDF21DRAFT_380956 [Thamnidium elegans]
MRFFSSLTAVFAIVISVNAAYISKRAPANVESCVSSFKYVSTEIDELRTVVQDGGILDTGYAYHDLQRSINSAQASCCSINTVIAEVDSDYVIGVINTITPKMQSALTLVATKKDDYNIFTRVLVENRVKELEKTTTHLNTCLNNFTPESKKSALQAYIDAINLAFSSTIAAYD